VILPAVGVEVPAGDGQSGAVGNGDVVAARPVVGGRAEAPTLRVGTEKGESAAGLEVLGDGREQEFGGDEPDGAEDGVNRVELLV
jgi:hypothetical protein